MQTHKTMNVENILKVADAIEKHTIADIGFNMFYVTKRGVRGLRQDRSGHNCGTIACIAGWTLQVFDHPDIAETDGDIPRVADSRKVVRSLYR